ncbi:MAG: bifunctional folylpolyglutamate synthase/dihydrofolate synthase [Rhodobacteraceae bacterium]|nr:MAG: bifunctional folylpolyglutamate synthase/dihydrofolate synthase [Paracoccaceae bacterium]
MGFDAHDAASDAILTRLLSLHPKIIDLTLDRVHRLLGAMGDPERSLPPVVHIAGTNGKGSTQAMMRAGLEAAGGRVHAYTSPHLARFHERIRIAGALIEEAHLAALLEECERANGGAPITFFEITTVAAFLGFARTPADWLLLEVGLGGRLDATNVVDRPRLTVITPVSFDHEQYLGRTLGKIAAEKAGIIKPGAPCVVGPQTDEAFAVIEARAEALGAPLIAEGRDWTARAERGRLVFEDGAGLLDLPLPNLPGPHQIDNAGAAIAGLRALGFDDAACEAAVTAAEWPARLQRLKRGPLADMAAAAGVELWLDGGHNVAAGAAVAAWFAARPPARLAMVCGMLETKDAAGYLRPFAPLAESLTTVDIPGAQAGLPAATLADAGGRVGLRAAPAPTIADALQKALADAGRGGRALICGSLYLAGYVLRDNG